jgi:hypothetical protein
LVRHGEGEPPAAFALGVAAANVPQGARARCAELIEQPLGRSMVRVGFPPAPGRQQQPHQRRLRPLVCGLEQCALAGLANRRFWICLEARDQDFQQTRPQPARLLAFGDQPTLELIRVRKVEPFEELAAKCGARLMQRRGRSRFKIGRQAGAKRGDVDDDPGSVEGDAVAIG